jgi:hypothetical protein
LNLTVTHIVKNMSWQRWGSFCQDGSFLDRCLFSDGLTLWFTCWCDIKERVFRSKVSTLN